MPISFNQIPNGTRTPFAFAEFDSTRSAQGPAIQNYRAMLLGMKLAAGTFTADTAVKVTNEAQVIAGAGRGSQLHRMYQAFVASNRATEVWCGVLAENGGGVAATGTVTITGPATGAGTLSLYIGGRRVTVAVASGDTATTIATALVAAIGATSGLKDYAVRASNVAGVVTLTAHHRGVEGNEIDVRMNYVDGDATPAGVAVAIVAMASGTLNPVLTTLIANLGDSQFHVIAHPYNDATSLSALEAELASRAGPMRMIDGFAITARNATLGTVSALGAGRNSPYSAIVRGAGDATPTPTSEIAAAVAGAVALSAQADPARPFQTLALPWVQAPAEIDRDSLSERDTLLKSGIATLKVVAGAMQIERLISTYQTNSAGGADVAYLDATTPLTLSYLRFSWRQWITSRYPRHKLANDGVRVGAGQAIITPKIAKAEALAWFREMESLGLVEGFDQFKADLVVERNVSDVNRLDFLMPTDLVNFLAVSATKFQFLL